MNLITLVLQAAKPAQQGSASMWIMLLLIVAVMYLFMIRPQRKQQKEMEKFRSELKKGDKVVTAGGIYGTICEVQERTVLLKVDQDTKIRVDKSSLQRDFSEATAPQNPSDKK